MIGEPGADCNARGGECSGGGRREVRGIGERGMGIEEERRKKDAMQCTIL